MISESNANDKVQLVQLVVISRKTIMCSERGNNKRYDITNYAKSASQNWFQRLSSQKGSKVLTLSKTGIDNRPLHSNCIPTHPPPRITGQCYGETTKWVERRTKSAPSSGLEWRSTWLFSSKWQPIVQVEPCRLRLILKSINITFILTTCLLMIPMSNFLEGYRMFFSSDVYAH